MTPRAARALLASILLTTSVFTSFTTPARADDEPVRDTEGAPTAPGTVALLPVAPPRIAPPRLHLTPAEALALTSPGLPTAAGLASPTQEIRLSKGAKTAIIVSAVVVGSLIILGLVVVAEPGRRL